MSRIARQVPSTVEFFGGKLTERHLALGEAGPKGNLVGPPAEDPFGGWLI